MGAGASIPTHRVRKMLLIRAYNARSEKETLHQQFSHYRRHHHQQQGGGEGKQQAHDINKQSKKKLSQSKSSSYLTVEDIKAALKVEEESSPWFDQLLQRFQLHEVGKIDYQSFMAFLETGAEPKTLDDDDDAAASETSTLELEEEEEEEEVEDRKLSSSLPMPNGSSPKAANVIAEEEGMAQQPHLKGEVKDSQAIVRHKGVTLNLYGQDGIKRPKPVAPLWRKRETLIQERIVEYTTIDADGAIQELVEREKSQTEVLHMECRETGEFAHRETTEYEQSEMFNNELVAEELGTEEYVHLKSKEDEYEFLESNMPPRGKAAAAAGGLGGEGGGGPGMMPEEAAAAGMQGPPEGFYYGGEEDDEEETEARRMMMMNPDLYDDEDGYPCHMESGMPAVVDINGVPILFPPSAAAAAGRSGHGRRHGEEEEVECGGRREEMLVGDDDDDEEEEIDPRIYRHHYHHQPTSAQGAARGVRRGMGEMPMVPPPPVEFEGMEPEEWRALYQAHQQEQQQQQQQQQYQRRQMNRGGGQGMQQEKEEEEKRHSSSSSRRDVMADAEKMDPSEWAAYHNHRGYGGGGGFSSPHPMAQQTRQQQQPYDDDAEEDGPGRRNSSDGLDDKGRSMGNTRIPASEFGDDGYPPIRAGAALSPPPPEYTDERMVKGVGMMNGTAGGRRGEGEEIDREVFDYVEDVPEEVESDEGRHSYNHHHHYPRE